MNRITLTLTLLTLGQYAQAHCGDDSGYKLHRLAAEDLQICWRTEPAVINVGEHFRVIVLVSKNHTPWSGALRVDAFMPIHKHGMNYLPVVTNTAKGHYVADGLMFHMPGEWRLDFKLEDEQERVELSSLLDVE